jgi:hypothetical protein
MRDYFTDVPVYWKPKYGTRSSRHRAWARVDARREAAQRRTSLWARVRARLSR